MKDIEGYEGIYAITQDGKVWSHPRIRSVKSNQPIGGKFLTLHQIPANRVNRDYFYVDLYKDWKRKKFYIHQLVARAFVPNPLNLGEINHKNGNKTDNRIENLEWCSHKENMHHMFRNGLRKVTVIRGQRIPFDVQKFVYENPPSNLPVIQGEIC